VTRSVPCQRLQLSLKPHKGRTLRRNKSCLIGHGRLEERTVSLASIEPMAVDFAFARSILIIEAQRLENKSAKTTAETRYYLSSLESQERTPSNG
jgi:hypothetical protein